MYVLVQEGKVVGYTEEQVELHPSYTLIESETQVPIGWLWDGSNFVWPSELEDEIRKLRNECLVESDRIVGRFISAGVEVPQEYVEFRQKLRDVPQQENFPVDVEFPEEPEITLPEYLY